MQLLKKQKNEGFPPSVRCCSRLKINQPYANLQSFIHLTHRLVVQMRNLVGKPLLIDRPDLLEQNNRVAVEPVRFRIDFHMGRQLRFLNLRSDCRNDYGWAEPVSDVILNDEHRPNSTLF